MRFVKNRESESRDIPVIRRRVIKPESPSTEIGLCSMSRRDQALDLLYRSMRGRVRRRFIAELNGQATRGEIDLSRLWVAVAADRVVGAMLTQALAGRAAAIWPPRVDPKGGLDRDRLAAAMVADALADYRRLGFHLAQALTAPGIERRAVLDLERGGLPRVTELVTMGWSSGPVVVADAGPPLLRWQPFEEVGQTAFADVLGQTYEGSRDMPELAGVRSLDEVLDGHRAGSGNDTSRWWLGVVPDEPAAAAVVLLSTRPEDEKKAAKTWEIAYFGLTPSARGRGLGRAALDWVINMARPHAARLQLAVDARNTPARRLYGARGFVELERRGVHLALLLE